MVIGFTAWPGVCPQAAYFIVSPGTKAEQAWVRLARLLVSVAETCMQALERHEVL